jgi:hypothetical protein
MTEALKSICAREAGLRIGGASDSGGVLLMRVVRRECKTRNEEKKEQFNRRGKVQYGIENRGEETCCVVLPLKYMT